jgi:integrase
MGRVFADRDGQEDSGSNAVTGPGRTPTGSGGRNGGGAARGRRGHGEDSVFLDASTGRWCAVVSLGRKADGRRERRKVTAKTKTEVLSKLRVLRRAVENGLYVEPRLTVGAYLDRWAAGLDARVRPNTADQYRFTIRCHLRPALGTKMLAKLTPAELDALWAAKLASGLRPNTVRLMRATLRRALHDAERDGLVVRNVAALSTPPRVEPPDGRTLTVDQARLLLDASRGDRLEAAYVLVLAFGLRRAELLGLAWTDLDVSDGLLAVRQQVTVRRAPQAADGSRAGRGVLELSPLKTGGKGRRTLELTPEIVTLIESHRARQDAERIAAGSTWQERGLIFATPAGTPIEPSSFSHAFSATARRAGLGRWHVHEARHTAASLMLAMGTKLEIVSRVLGHSSVTVTADVYSHLPGGEKRAAAVAITKALLEQR